MVKEYFLTRYAGTPSVVFGFHGCRQSIARKVLAQGEPLNLSYNDYDWLGSGIYFWEANPARALNWAQKYRDGDGPAIIGACIDLSNCLNLLDEAGLKEVQQSYVLYKAICDQHGIAMPRNKNVPGNEDRLRRYLDCAVIQYLHKYRTETKEPPYSTVRGVFWEGRELYPEAGFKEKNHIQICVTDPKAILCYFHPQCYVDINMGRTVCP